ncbi:MAG: hypothetical protein BWY04_00205 [candidate division CPR1 bacterium ADurb.Bin160]|uniref:Uncharacterized protein n=1 Tax=candidate division CPR1 bacterium ADurb.Bin160 TaxID=1852826 RepID=A0A1V5ZQE8_9BACT|nr:MAG: hypothetical protein BWY04_00205 [candidate division CPR1 bacterium ADurb.Bin160]
MMSFAHGFCHSSSTHQLIICANTNPYHHCSFDFITKLSCQFVTFIFVIAPFVQEIASGHRVPIFSIVFFVIIFHRLSEIFKFACKSEFIEIESCSVFISTIFAGAGFTVTGMFRVGNPEIDIEIISSHALKLGIK